MDIGVPRNADWLDAGSERKLRETRSAKNTDGRVGGKGMASDTSLLLTTLKLSHFPALSSLLGHLGMKQAFGGGPY
jgi:hypothetical protein